MGDAEEGGGGSVQWKLEAKKVDEGKAHHQHVVKKVDQDGEDKDGEVGKHFTVSVLIPKDFEPDEKNRQREFLELLKSRLAPSTHKDRVYFNLRIEEKTPAQIRVSWGESMHHEGTALEERKEIAGS